MPQQAPPRPATGAASAKLTPGRAPPPITVDRAVAASSVPAMSPSRQQQPSESSSWMKMLSSTFLGDASLFSRKAPALMNSSPSGATNRQAKSQSKHGLDHTTTFKIALVGGSGVGKTSILRRWLQRPYASKYSPTIGVDVISTPFRYKDEEILLQIWDVSSVEVDNTQSALHSLICEELDGIFFVFNVHRVSSIAAIDKWRHSLAKYVSAKEIPFFLLSHKADMIQKRIMSSDDIASYAKSAGYRGWMWTVGRPNFGENEKNPAVLDALERMVDCIWKDRQLKPRNVVWPVGIFDSPDKPRELEVVHVDADLHSFSASLLRIPTKAITTLPRDENLLPIEETFDKKTRRNRLSDADNTQSLTRRNSSFGGNWMLGNDKGMYLRVTDDSVVADHEESEEEEEKEEDAAKDKEEDEADEEEAEVAEGDHEKSMGSASAGDDATVTNDEVKVVQEVTKPVEAAEEERPSVVAIVDVVKKAPTSDPNDHDAWRFFAGSISRARAEEILSGREEGTFLLRRKDAQTLILSYVGSEQLHHALIEYRDRKYHVGSAKTSQAAFATLSRCLRSVRKYANRGLVFTRNTDFRVVNKEEMALQEDQSTHSKHPKGAKLQVTTTSSSWRPGSANVTPKTAKKMGVSPKRRGQRPSSGLLAQQEHVRVPPKARIDELSSSFYNQLTQRLEAFNAKQKDEQADATPEDSEYASVGLDSSIDITALLEMVHQELKQLQSMDAADAEGQWRQLVKNMELWNRIVMNLELH